MKAQTNKPVKRQLILVMMILSLIIGSYAQKSAVILNDDVDLEQLKSLVEVLYNTKTYQAELYFLPSVINNMETGSTGLKSDITSFVPEISASDDFMNIEEEGELVVEDWMLDENYFMTPLNSNEMSEAEEEKLVVEDWMLDESHFYTSDANLHSDENITEGELQVEDWMLDPNHWVLGAK